MNACLHRWRLASPLLLLAASAACSAAPPEVPVSRPVAAEVTDYEDFTGRIEAAQTVDLRARVTGYLVKIAFRAGSAVNQGDLLFEIDPRPYQAELDKAQAEVTRAEARLKRLTADFERAKKLMAGGGIGAENFDRIAGDREEAQAALHAAQAARDVAKLNLSFTKVTAPIAGKIGQPALDAGNLVVADTTSLARIVSVDPLFVYFDIDERTFLRLRRTRLADRARGERELEPPVMIGLSDEDGYPHRGTVDFIDNRVDPTKGTIRCRAAFPNRQGQLLPGMFARVRLATSAPHKALLVPETAIGSDQGRRYVFVVDDRDVLERRPVKLGLSQDGLREVLEGLTAGDRVAVDLTKARQRTTIRPKDVAIPERPETPREKREPGERRP
jgi:RND family efflux transporter MFP subunit